MRKLIIWDWNGTLLNDVETCVEAMNVMLKKRNMSPLDKDTYKSIFTFPVKDYYKTLGFNFEIESFEKLSVEYINLYKKISETSPLQIGVVEALKYFEANGYKQIILSASEQKALEYQVKERDLEQYFNSILGLNNIYAKSKVDNAINYLKNTENNFDQIIFIGDTFHDYEVAQEIGADCVLVENGHQNLQVFNIGNKAILIKDLTKVIECETLALN